jgi:NAD(P)H-dependent flavin oxidoreductase YrpB (nitropropane dioxygenase family)
MNMIGHPKHVQKCLDLKCDMICAQGGEGGGHTGHVPSTVLIPSVVALCKGKTSPMTGKPVQVIAAGGIYNGETLAAALMLGASAVWVGTRFVLSEEAGAPKAHQEAVRTAGFDDNVRTIIFTVSMSVIFLLSANARTRAVRCEFAAILISRTGKRTARTKSRS